MVTRLLTDCFLIRFEACFAGGIHVWNRKAGQKFVTGEAVGLSGEAAAAAWLHEHGISNTLP